MSAVATAARELWGLFVDDGSLALGLLLWCGAAVFALPRLGLPPGWAAPILFLGCLAVLLENVARAARRKAGRGQAGPVVVTYAWIALGSALGGMARYWCSLIVAETVGGAFPLGTLVVNVAGSFVIGLAAAVNGPDGRFLLGPTARQFVMTGLCGGYTTFSSFSLQTQALMREGDWPRAGANVLLSVVLCLAAVWLGHLAALGINRLQGGA